MKKEAALAASFLFAPCRAELLGLLEFEAQSELQDAGALVAGDGRG